ncbi:DUF465 domain-containing protein [Parvularcula sp. BGMRC 0090]|uniref:DUF465 domain-containing protein n=2 Tax=Parvularcula maris TaxID=2965077 RepID=A0A9X2RIU3_9PROT|nr:DUF465 domain-containing protein [Parvularcula maris]MCQ8186419.1 DUF465 domain-containing protein [Parvularcula maris]
MTDGDRPSFGVIEGDAGKAEPVPDPGGANDEALQMKIAELEEEHRDLDQAIISMEERMPYDRLTIGRMKKRKLVLKDQIEELRDRLFPDIIA